VTRVATPVVALLVGLALAAPTRAQDAPTELWSEYPLVPKVEQAAPSPVAPFLPPPVAPPSDEGSPVADDSSGLKYWLPLMAVAAILLLLGTRPVRQASPTGGHVLGVRVGALRGRARQLRTRPKRRPPARSADRTRTARRPVQYAPTAEPVDEVVVEVESPSPRAEERDDAPEPVPYITRRSGLVRSRYLVVTDDSGRALRRSRAFWRIGGAGAQLRRAEAAWDNLANDLRADGWELDTVGRSEYYVPLRRAIVSTLEPYTQARSADSGDA
jgi:hypothetical protein